MNTAIVYCSKHHGNTRKLVEAIAAKHDVTLIDAQAQPDAELSGYDVVGFASGIYGFQFDPQVTKLAGKVLEGQRVFLLYTSAMNKDAHAKGVRQALAARGAVELGIFGCQGYNTFGPFRLVGGTSKGHPDAQDIANAVAFFEQIVGKLQ